MVEQPHVLTGNALVGGVGGNPVKFVKPEPKPAQLTAEQEIRKLLEEHQARADKLAFDAGILRDQITELEFQIETLDSERSGEQIQIDAFQRVLIELRAASIAANDTDTQPKTAAIKTYAGPHVEVPASVRQGLVERDVAERTAYKAPPKKHAKRRRVSPFRATEKGILELVIMLLEEQTRPLTIQEVCDGVGMSRRDKRGAHSLGSLLLLESKKSNPRIIHPGYNQYAIAPKKEASDEEKA